MLALEGLIRLAALPREEYHTLAEICPPNSPTPPYFAKVFQRLSLSPIVSARRGPGGGYKLTISPQEITLEAVILASTEQKSLSSCLLRDAPCGSEPACPLHKLLKDEQIALSHQITSLTLEDLLESEGA